MDQGLGEIRIASTDKAVNEHLRSLKEGGEPFSRRFGQGEEFLLCLPSRFLVPSLPIHHDVRVREPSAEYREKILSLVRELGLLVPGVLEGLSFMFDPGETLRPSFFQLFRIAETPYLFLLRLDLQWRPQEHETLSRGDNDRTAEYRSRRLYLESDLIPLEEVLTENSRITGFRIRRSVSRTWIGEKGRGYFSQGIWIDQDITRFFSRLFLPPEKRLYPYFPYTCKHRAICRTVVEPEAGKRKRLVPLLHRARLFLEPRMGEIEAALKTADFSEDLESFRKLKALIPRDWYEEWENTRVRPFLNEWDMKEYELEISD